MMVIVKMTVRTKTQSDPRRRLKIVDDLPKARARRHMAWLRCAIPGNTGGATANVHECMHVCDLAFLSSIFVCYHRFLSF